MCILLYSLKWHMGKVTQSAMKYHFLEGDPVLCRKPDHAGYIARFLILCSIPPSVGKLHRGPKRLRAYSPISKTMATRFGAMRILKEMKWCTPCVWAACRPMPYCECERCASFHELISHRDFLSVFEYEPQVALRRYAHLIHRAVPQPFVLFNSKPLREILQIETLSIRYVAIFASIAKDSPHWGTLHKEGCPKRLCISIKYCSENTV